ncbi:hypothetical protein KFK09_004721 [Dendrobium nobile]|uniref:DNL-type domain-containing protein n=1 Tax=Dendrobium nobile TaxID=94219 RepID=A0A8T3BYK4_DENNO|nr:hypothetical protein KFK09_004721 [Dendrobium nobile]
MGFAVPSKGLILAIARDTPDRGGSLIMLRFSVSSSLPFTKSKPRISLQSSSRQIKRSVSACSNEDYAPSGDLSSSKEASFNMKLPRRNMIVQFTCNSCGGRTQRRVNRVAYERGTVFVQCAGCMKNHKLVDNLGLVVEYDLRENLDPDFDGTL